MSSATSPTRAHPSRVCPAPDFAAASARATKTGKLARTGQSESSGLKPRYTCCRPDSLKRATSVSPPATMIRSCSPKILARSAPDT